MTPCDKQDCAWWARWAFGDVYHLAVTVDTAFSDSNRATGAQALARCPLCIHFQRIDSYQPTKETTE